MRCAYADPPYPGQARRWYGNQSSFDGEIDHAELLRQLGKFDAWALSTSSAALRDVIALCPADVRVAVWYRPNSEPPGNRGRWHWSWEPVIVRGGRWKYGEGISVRDVLVVPKDDATRQQLPGQKPAVFCSWILDLLGYRDGDQFDDLFPGSGVVGRVAAQGKLPWNDECVWGLPHTGPVFGDPITDNPH